MQVNLLFLVSPTCFGRCFRPPSGALDCIYSIWQYLPKQLPAGVLDQLAATWMNTTRYCKLLIQSSAPDGGRKHRPKQVQLTRNNKLTYIVAYCWLLLQSQFNIKGATHVLNYEKYKRLCISFVHILFSSACQTVVPFIRRADLSIINY